MSQNLPTTPATRFQLIFNDALEEYKKRTKNDLTAHPLAAQLQLCDRPSAVLTVLQDQAQKLQQSRSNDERLTKWLGPTVNILYALSETLGEGVGLVFSPAKVIFVGMGVLLIAARDTTASIETLIDLFERIQNFFKRLETYVEVTPTAEMMDISMKIMVEVLSVLSIATKEIKERRIKKFFKKLAGRSDVEDALKRLDTLTQEEARMAITQVLKVTHSVDVTVAAVYEDGNETRKIVEKTATDVEETMRYQMQNNFRRWLSPPDPSSNHIIACSTQHQGTATWFLGSSTFEEWKSTPSLLWIHGKPGSGKSILCSSIIQDIVVLCEADRASMGYFYFDFRDAADKQNRRNLLLSLLSQLSAQSDSCFDILLRLYSKHGNGAQKPRDGVLTQCLKEMLLLTNHNPTYIILDALDECPNSSGVPSAREQVLQLLKDLDDLSLPNLHICVTSRPEIDIRTALEPLAFRAVSLHDQSGQKQDIAEYVTSVVYSDLMMKRWREDDKNLVIETLVEKADGMFRWVFCQLEVLRHCLPPSVRQTLDELPDSLDETYERVLREIKKPNQVHAHHLLQCLMVAVRPLTVEELGEILAVEQEAGGVPKLHSDWRWEDQEQAVLSACSSLISVVEFFGHRTVQFSHFSVKEYLSSNRLATSSGDVSRYHILLESAHATLAQACLAILFQLDEHVDGFTINHIPLAEYSAEYWINHAQFGNVSTRIQVAMERLFDPEKRHFQLWVRVHDIDKDYWPNFSWAPSSLIDAPGAALYYAALCGFRGLVDRLLTRYPEHIHAMGGVHGTALHAASRGNHCEVIQAIVGHGGDVNVRSHCGKTPLHVASPAGQLDAARWLLQHGADVNALDDERRNPLHVLMQEGRLGTVAPSHVTLSVDVPIPKLRNYHGASDPESRQRDQTAEVARLLLKHGVDVDANDQTGQTVGDIASARYPYAVGLLRDLSHDLVPSEN